MSGGCSGAAARCRSSSAILQAWPRLSAPEGRSLLCPHDHRVGDLVVPALLVRVPQDPEHAEEDDEGAEQEADVAHDAGANRQRRSVGPRDFDVHRTIPKGLAAGRPEVNEIDGPRDRPQPGQVDKVENRPKDRYQDAVDEDGHEARAEANQLIVPPHHAGGGHPTVRRSVHPTTSYVFGAHLCIYGTNAPLARHRVAYRIAAYKALY